MVIATIATSGSYYLGFKGKNIPKISKELN